MKYISLGKLLLPQLDGVSYKPSTIRHKDETWLMVEMEKRIGKQAIRMSANAITPNKGGLASIVKMFPNPTGLVSATYTTFRGRKAHREICLVRGADNQKRYTIRLAFEEKERTYILSCIALESIKKPAIQLWERFLKEIKENPTP
ncbi:hypothetical protein [Armatimonas sp.]|uniref:hypothetical protein n=1 Tax=Armatimonas sp. TaxID=1872638 RepID=UPI00286AD3E7|nr:hypothetical protein [Armatimonas sp.]